MGTAALYRVFKKDDGDTAQEKCNTLKLMTELKRLLVFLSNIHKEYS